MTRTIAGKMSMSRYLQLVRQRTSTLGISQLLAIGFGLAIVLMLTASTYAVIQIALIADQVDDLIHKNHTKSTLAYSVKDSLNASARSMRNVLFLTVAKEINQELFAVSRAEQTAQDILDRFKQMAGSDQERKAFQEVISARDEYAPKLAAYLKLIRDGEIEQARDLALPDIVPVQQRYLDSLDRLIQQEAGGMESTGRAVLETAGSTRVIVLALAIGATFLAILVGIFVSRRITRPLVQAIDAAKRIATGDLTVQLRKTTGGETGALTQALAEMIDSLVHIVSDVRRASQNMSRSAGEIAQGNQDLSTRTESQASSLEETAATVEELTSTVKQNADNARQANQLASSASDVATRGGTVMQQVVETMATINESAKRIADITSVIDGIAFQTNILALNAAVEAARAGEQGRGFAVVASEVRGLAQRSADAAKQIKELIADSIEKAKAGSRLVDQAGGTIEDVVVSARHVTDIIGEIAAAGEEQRTGIEQVNRAVAQIDQITQQNAALVEEAAAAAQTMHEQANELIQVVSVFRVSEHVPDGAAYRKPMLPMFEFEKSAA
ncbi:methyl-accepting chemotaxis protein [Noviherbaspirillum galbum]|uniref:HAMP domain-containing protein n=1 Tax=Noviherbaspirillum galbum TaxID=2709383 RepID=A0A6B3SNR0_9BURK|nr:methyl-accepting chemotaxis protein [Noviherbaspirillum galbum]NEX62138.1 HAMP domain-containing protein [Noviherbaspirillum galbum]